MFKLRIVRLISALLLAALLPAAAGCGPSEAELTKIKTQGDRYLAQGLDPEGYSKADIEKMSDREQYELFKKRYERTYNVAGDIMTIAAGPEQEWEVTYFGYYPDSGDLGQNPVPRGARPEDTYTFGPTIIAQFDEPFDYKAVVEKVQAWMIEQDFNTSNIGNAHVPGDSLRVDGLTQDGIQTWFTATSKNVMGVNIFAGPYWGDPSKLLRLLANSPDDLDEQYRFILPYEHLPFPAFRGDNP